MTKTGQTIETNFFTKKWTPNTQHHQQLNQSLRIGNGKNEIWTEVIHKYEGGVEKDDWLMAGDTSRRIIDKLERNRKLNS